MPTYFLQSNTIHNKQTYSKTKKVITYHLLSSLFAGHCNICITCTVTFNPNYNLMRKILHIIPISQLRKLKLGQDKAISKKRQKWNCIQICFASNSKFMLLTITLYYCTLLNKRDEIFKKHEYREKF